MKNYDSYYTIQSPFIKKGKQTNPNIFITKFAEIKHEYLVSTAAVMARCCLTERLPAETSIFFAELRAILLTFKYIDRPIHNKFVICTDSLSSLQAIGGL